jgi:hypothetical protein
MLARLKERWEVCKLVGGLFYVWFLMLPVFEDPPMPRGLRFLTFLFVLRMILSRKIKD